MEIDQDRAYQRPNERKRKERSEQFRTEHVPNRVPRNDQKAAPFRSHYTFESFVRALKDCHIRSPLVETPARGGFRTVLHRLQKNVFQRVTLVSQPPNLYLGFGSQPV